MRRSTWHFVLGIACSCAGWYGLWIGADELPIVLSFMFSGLYIERAGWAVGWCEE